MSAFATAGAIAGGLAIINDGLGSVIALATNLQRAGRILMTVQAEGRDDLTPEEWAVLEAADATAAARLREEIARQRAATTAVAEPAP